MLEFLYATQSVFSWMLLYYVLYYNSVFISNYKSYIDKHIVIARYVIIKTFIFILFDKLLNHLLVNVSSRLEFSENIRNFFQCIYLYMSAMRVNFEGGGTN